MNKIYLPVDSGTKLEVCRPTPASENLLGRDWHETADYFAVENQKVVVNRTRRLQTRAALNAKHKHITSEEMKLTLAARASIGDQSKSERKKGIRSNRAQERLRDQVQQAWELGEVETNESSPISDDKPSNARILGNKIEGEYVPPSRKTERIRKIRDTEWEKRNGKQ
jgi:hypothetical protein